jgi:hypothetical protein
MVNLRLRWERQARENFSHDSHFTEVAEKNLQGQCNHGKLGNARIAGEGRAERAN